MRIKNYYDFIYESINEYFEEKGTWTLSTDEIEEYFLHISDEKWLVSVDIGFINEKYPIDSITNFSKTVKPNEENIPAYLILIENNRSTNNVDVTDYFLTAINVISDLIESDNIKLYDQEGLLNKDDIILNGGIFLGKDESEDQQIEIEGNGIAIVIAENKKVTLKQNEVAKYYGWDYDYEDKEGNIYIEIDIQKLAYEILDSRSDYYDIIVKGIEILYDSYIHYYDYLEDTDSVFNYYLDEYNSKLTVKAIIKEFGGFNNLDIELDEEFSSEEDFIEYVLNERNHYTLERISRIGSEIFDDVRRIISDFNQNALAEENYDIIMSEFDSEVSDLFECTTFEKEVEKSYTTTNKNGEKKAYKYTDIVKFYRINFNNEWLDDNYYEDYDEFKHIYDIFYEYINSYISSIKLNPRLRDYPNSINEINLNFEIKSLLEDYLK